MAEARAMTHVEHMPHAVESHDSPVVSGQYLHRTFEEAGATTADSAQSLVHRKDSRISDLAWVNRYQRQLYIQAFKETHGYYPE